MLLRLTAWLSVLMISVQAHAQMAPEAPGSPEAPGVPFAPEVPAAPGTSGNAVVQNAWNPNLPSVQQVTAKLQQLLTSAPASGPQRVGYFALVACTIDAVTRGRPIETAFQTCTGWAQSANMPLLLPSAAAPNVAASGPHDARALMATLGRAEKLLGKRYPGATSETLWTAAACSADDAMTNGTVAAFAPDRLAACAHAAGITEEQRKPPARTKHKANATKAPAP